MDQRNVHFERVGIAYMPCTAVGWGCLFAFTLATLALIFLAQAVWASAGWQGAEVVQGAILVTAVLATVRFAHKRSIRTVTIGEVGLDEDRRVFIRPNAGDYDLIYRAGMEVCWNRDTGRLSHPHPPRDWTPTRWFQQIVAAVAGEYGVRLRLTDETVWTKVPDEMRAEIEANPAADGQ